MMRPVTTFGCTLALTLGTAGFLGCEEQGIDQATYESERYENLDTTSPNRDGTGVGLDTDPMMQDRGTAPTPPATGDMQTQPRTPAIPDPQDDLGDTQPLPQSPTTPPDATGMDGNTGTGGAGAGGAGAGGTGTGGTGTDTGTGGTGGGM